MDRDAGLPLERLDQRRPAQVRAEDGDRLRPRRRDLPHHPASTSAEAREKEKLSAMSSRRSATHSNPSRPRLAAMRACTSPV
jgi:hypothetical protein